MRRAHIDNLETTRKLIFLDYDKRLAQADEENAKLRDLNENFESILEQEKKKYVF